MSVNSSSFDDLPSNSSIHPFLSCFSSRTNVYIFTAYSITSFLLLLPIYVLILFLGYQQRRKHGCGSTAATSHADVFTYHSIGMQLSEFLGITFQLCGNYVGNLYIIVVGLCVTSVSSFSGAQFHLLTCVERYLAVVHPITYLGLRQTVRIRIRDISIGCVWFLTFGWLALSFLSSEEVIMILYFCLIFIFISVISFCSISVLCALKRPGPGEAGGNRQRVDQSKQRAFHTIMAIMGVLLLRFGGNLIANVVHKSSELIDPCVVTLSITWLDLPSNLVLPLLFLQRAGKLRCCKPKH